MTIRTFAAAVLSLVLVASSSLTASAQSPLTLYYDPDTGNLKLQNTTSGSVGVTDVNVLTVGNGSVGPVSGRPDNVGWLSNLGLTGTANLPTTNVAFATQPNEQFATNGLYSLAAATSFGNAMFTLAPYSSWSTSSPIGPVGSYWDFGNIAVPGMTQADLNFRFITTDEFNPLPGMSYAFGANAGSATSATASVVALTPVPEPSTYAMAVAGAIGGGFMMRRRRKTA